MARGYDSAELERARRSPKEQRGLSKLAQLRAGSKATKPDELPAAGGFEAMPFTWRIVGGSAKQEAVAAAVARLDQIGIPPELMGADPLEDELGWQTLWRAMREAPEDPSADKATIAAAAENPLATTVDELRELLTTDERDLLMTRYADFEEEVYPAPHQLTDAELAAMTEAAKKKSGESQAQLMSFGTWNLALFATSLVARLESLSSGMSGGSPTSETDS